ncbi:hypothetical protein bas34_0145 [Escherichia phage SelmaRatti]|uniref:Uncharacterized protein n=1 Tax=Escherichia phage SelmaRatti TaxID=2852006 RepID=A0AAE7VYE4_9CAUD|nr:hypothetical protein bas34_0145 [Escherichia phage SelmaRatti]
MIPLVATVSAAIGKNISTTNNHGAQLLAPPFMAFLKFPHIKIPPPKLNALECDSGRFRPILELFTT